MSDTSIHFKDQGYTSPDFLTNLFKKPLYSSFSLSSFDTLPNSCREINSSSTKQNDLPTLTFEKKNSSPLKFKNHTSNIGKYYNSTPLIDQQKISNSKYKIFFKTMLNGAMKEQQLNHLWSKLQQSLKNPFLFDRFIDQIKEKNDKETELKNCYQHKQCLQQVSIKVNCKTPEKKYQSNGSQYLNSESRKKINNTKIDLQKSIKEEIRRNVIDIRQIFLKGEKQIRQK